MQSKSCLAINSVKQAITSRKQDEQEQKQKWTR